MAKTPKRGDGRKEKKVTINGVRYSVYGRTEQELMENILRKREELEEAAFKPGKELTLDEYVIRFIDNRRDTFWNARGGYIDAAHVGQDVKRMCRLCGVKKFTPHAFRDTFATRCIESGMTMKTLQEILGHSDISMTMNLYAHCMEETKVKEMANVNIAL